MWRPNTDACALRGHPVQVAATIIDGETASRLRQERLAGSRSREERSQEACCRSPFILGPFLARPMTTANQATSNWTSAAALARLIAHSDRRKPYQGQPQRRRAHTARRSPEGTLREATSRNQARRRPEIGRGQIKLSDHIAAKTGKPFAVMQPAPRRWPSSTTSPAPVSTKAMRSMCSASFPKGDNTRPLKDRSPLPHTLETISPCSHRLSGELV